METKAQPAQLSLWDRQVLLEQDMQRLGIERIRRNIQKSKERGEEAATVYGRDLLSEALEPVANGIKAYLAEADSGAANRSLQYAKHPKALEPETVAYCALKTILNGITEKSSLTGVALSVGTLIEDELRHRYFEEKEPGLWVVTRKRVERQAGGSYRVARKSAALRMKGLGVQFDAVLSQKEKLHLGTRIIDIVAETTQLVSIETLEEGYKKTRACLLPTEKTRAWIQEKISRCELLSSEFMPCLIPPKPWVKPVGGGYHTEYVRRLRLVKSRSKPYLDELFSKTTSGQLDRVYRSINALQNTAWKIHRPVYDVMRALWDAGAVVPVMPQRENYELPTKPIDIDTNKLTRRAWRTSAAKVYRQNIALSSERYAMSKMLSLANRFKDEEAIYFPHQLDFRGRAYPVASYLQPQGADNAKALLTFSRGVPINTQDELGWLAIHGANVYGYDKVSLDERIKWVADNGELIVSTALQPLDDHRWMKADKPWQFLAFCCEYNAFLEHGFGFISHLPVAVDGSCNGLQHFSAMLRDPVGGAAVNLLPSDLPQDIYQAVADVVVKKLQSLPNDSLAIRWLEFGITRKTTKRPVMVLPYGGTRFSCTKFIDDFITEALIAGRPNLFQDDRKKASIFLAKIVWESIGEVVVAAKEAMSWLQESSKVLSAEELPINWTTPSGFLVQQSYFKTKGERVNISLKVGSIKLTLESDLDKLDKSRQRNGISPNFVHSMDASALVLCVNSALDQGIQDFAMVHDSYATHASNMQVFGACLRESFVALYEQNVLALFRDEVSRVLLNSTLPELPKQGTLDLTRVLESDFFFAS